MLSERSARLASTFVVLFLIGSGTTFAYATRAPSVGVHPGAGGASSPHPSGATHAAPSPAEDSNETRTGSNSTESESSTSSHSTTSSSHSTSSLSATRTKSETHSSTTSEQTHSENETESSTTSVRHTTSTENHNETSSTFKHTGESETSTSTGESGSQEHAESNETESANEQGENQSGELQFHFVSATANQKGFGEVGVEIDGLILDVQAHVERLNASTQYTLALLVNGTSHTLGTVVTSKEGGGEIHAQFNATKPGTYSIGVSLLLGGGPALKGDPASRTVVLAQSATNTSEHGNQRGEHVNTVQGNQEHEREIKKAEENNSIPAVVQVTESGATASVFDSKFSVSVGKLAGNGLAIQITGTNVTGPRVLLVNLSSPASLTTNSLLVTLDGNSITQAASLTQILNPPPGDPARYIVISTSTGLQLLVSIPHFSTHIIEILPAVAQAVGNFLAVDGPALALSLLAVTVVFASVYARRTRIRL